MTWRGWRRADGKYLRLFGPQRRRPNPLLVLWRWRHPVVLAAGVPLGFGALAQATDPVAAAVVALSAGACGLWWPPARRLVVGRTWCVIVEHRLRVGMVQADIISWSGWLPAILWTRPAPRGVRVTLWCPAGVDVQDFEQSRSLLAAACWAADVEVARHPRWAHVVVLLVVKRPD